MSQKSWLAYLNLLWLLYPQKLASLKATIQPLLGQKLPKNAMEECKWGILNPLPNFTTASGRPGIVSIPPRLVKNVMLRRERRKHSLEKKYILMFRHLYQPSPVTPIIVSINAICIILLFIWSLYKFIPSCDRRLMLLLFPLWLLQLCLAKVNVISQHRHQYGICPKVTLKSLVWAKEA